jgi:hypothetical protein
VHPRLSPTRTAPHAWSWKSSIVVGSDYARRPANDVVPRAESMNGTERHTTLPPSLRFVYQSKSGFFRNGPIDAQSSTAAIKGHQQETCVQPVVPNNLVPTSHPTGTTADRTKDSNWPRRGMPTAKPRHVTRIYDMKYPSSASPFVIGQSNPRSDGQKEKRIMRKIRFTLFIPRQTRIRVTVQSPKQSWARHSGMRFCPWRR